MIGWDIRNQQIFHSKVDGSHAYNPNMLFDDPNDRTYQKVIHNCVRRETQNPSKIHPGTFQSSFECTCVPLDHQHCAKMVPRTSKVSQNGDARTLKEDENQQCPITSAAAKKIHSKQCSLNFNEGPAAGAKP